MEIEDKNPVKPLISNPHRQAHRLFQALTYQIWQSVYEWINLKENEYLYLESAEDYDTQKKNDAKIVQVKHLNKSINLNSKEVLEAIVNYWNAKKLNTNYYIQYHLLTTATRNYERQKPFGANKGLDYWEKCRSGLEDITPLRNTLLNIGERTSIFPPDLTEFMRSSTDNEFISLLLAPINWNTGSERKPNVKKLIENKILLFAEENGKINFDEEKVIQCLKEYVEDTICQNDLSNRRLTRSDFLRVFKEATMVLIPLETFNNMSALANTAQSFMENFHFSTESKSTVIAENNILQSVPVLETKYLIKRNKMVFDILSTLSTKGIVIIQGSTGMGKSILAKLLVNNELEKWRFSNFTGYTPIQIRQTLSNINEIILSKKSNIILDDLDFSNSPHIFEDALESLIINLRDKGYRLIVTSQKPITLKLRTNLYILEKSNIAVPKFTYEEVTELLTLFKCPSQFIKLWAKVILSTSKGHPLLIHARIQALHEQSWPQPKTETLFDTTPINIIQEQTRTELIDLLPSENARELVYRLSVFTSKFQRKNALYLADYPTKINEPGIFLDKLIGPYVEKIDADYFQLTPLLDNSARINYKEEDFKRLHELAGYSYISKTLTPLDLSNIFMHGIISDSGYLLFSGCSAFQSINEKDKKYIYPYLDWLTIVKLNVGEKMFKEDEGLSMMLRHIQFRIASESYSSDVAIKIAEAWESEASTYTGRVGFGKKYPAQSKIMPFLFYLTIFSKVDIQFPIEKYSKWLCDSYEYLDKHQELSVSFFSKLNTKLSGEKFEYYPIETLLSKKITYIDLLKLINVIKVHKKGNYVFSVINDNLEYCSRLVDHVWLEESKKPSPQWESVITSLRELIMFTNHSKFVNISATAFKAIAVIQEEFLNDTQMANRTLMEGLRTLGNQHLILINYQAKILLFHKDYKKALEIWQRILPLWKNAGNLTLALNYRDASVCAGSITDWFESAKLSLLAAKNAKAGGILVFEQQCMADYAFALWKQGDNKNAINIFSGVINSFEHLPSPQSNLNTLGLMKMLANAFIWFLKMLNPSYKPNENNFKEPFPGMFSNLDFSKTLKELPYTEPYVLWIFLANVEYEARTGNTIYKKLISIEQTLPILFRAEAKIVIISTLLYSGKLDSLVQEIANLVAFTRLALDTDKNHQALVEIPLSYIAAQAESNMNLILYSLTYGILTYAKKNEVKNLPIIKWSQDIKKLNLENNYQWQKWYELVKNYKDTSIYDFSTIMKDANLSYELRILASIFVLTQEANPRDELQASIFATLGLYDMVYWKKDLEESLEILIIKRWNQITSEQKMSLSAPHLNVPIINKACSDEKNKGLKKVANIILCVRYSIDLELSQEIIGKLKGIASN